jgi:hypothetical protein
MLAASIIRAKAYRPDAAENTEDSHLDASRHENRKQHYLLVPAVVKRIIIEVGSGRGQLQEAVH